VASYGLPPETACWVPGQAMAMVLRAHNAFDPDTLRRNPVGMSLITPPRVDPLTYAAGQTIHVLVTNRWLNLDDVSRVQIYHEEQPIGDFASLAPDGVSAPYMVVEPGVHTFWTEVTYTHKGEDTCSGDYAVAHVVREPALNGSTLLVLSPAAWESATTDFAAFKRGLGFSVNSVTTETLAGGGTLTPARLRAAFSAYAAGCVPSNALGHVLLVGDFDVIPAPSFLVRPEDGSHYESDVYYRDLAAEFDADGDGMFGEYADDGNGDFTGDEVRAAFPSFTNHLIVGRLPLPTSAVPADVENALAGSIAFEQEVGARKDGAILTAGRIMDVLDLPSPLPDVELPADSWEYVLSNIVETIVTDHTNRDVTTVVHVSPSYANRHNIDYAVVGDDITGDYVHGQSIVRGLWQTNDACAFLCNVSHGGANYDFSLRRKGAGFPANVSSAVGLSMSCASYPLGVSAWTSGLAVAYIGSVATVTPDIESLTIRFIPGITVSGTMVSAEIQEIATLRLFVDRRGIGHAFAEAFNHYIAELPGRNGGAFIQANAEAALRNAIGYQIIGDPTLVVSYEDTDADGLLDPQEVTLGTSITNADTDADGLTDGFEVDAFGTSPVNMNTDGDPHTDHEEMVADTDGTDSNDYFRITGVSMASPAVIGFASSSNRFYSLYGRSALITGDWSLITAKTGKGGIDALADTNSLPKGAFYRLKVSKP